MTSPLPKPTVKWVLLSWQGRLSKQSYFWGAALLIVAQIYMLTIAAGMDRNDENSMLGLGFGAIALWLLSAWAIYAMSIKRLHDIGFSGKLAICIFIPFISLLFIFAMMIIPGSLEPNEHGPPPFGPPSAPPSSEK